MDFSLWLPANLPWDDLRTAAEHAAATGWHGIWLADHFMPDAPGSDQTVDKPMGECFAQLAALAAVVPRVRIGSMVAGNTYRHPAVLAKSAASIDLISGGRFVLGLGAGWQVNEHRAYGIDRMSTPDRIRRFREACEVVTGLRDNDRTTLDGTYYQLDDAPLNPKPVGPLPLMIGASGERTMPGIVAKYADEWNCWGTPETFAHKSAVMTAACEKAGRDPRTLRRTTQALVFLGENGAQEAERRGRRAAIGGSAEELRDIFGQYREAGVDEYLLNTMGMTSGTQIAEFADRFRTEISEEIGSM